MVVSRIQSRDARCTIDVRQARRAFTLVELILVIVVIGILASILLPSFAKAKRRGMRAKSINNQKQIGLAYRAYIEDHKDYYPQVRGFAGVGGKLGALGDLAKTIQPQPWEIDLMGASTLQEDRPLNKYVVNIDIFHDPADNGGTKFGVDSCFEALGNSYQPQVGADFFRVKRVLGETAETKDSYAWRSIRDDELRDSLSNKIIQGDWNWPWDSADSWHGEKGEAGHIMLYADGHAAYFVFPPSQLMANWAVVPVKNGPDGSPLVDTRNNLVLDDIKFRAASPVEYRTIGQAPKGRDAKYIDPGFDWW